LKPIRLIWLLCFAVGLSLWMGREQFIVEPPRAEPKETFQPPSKSGAERLFRTEKTFEETFLESLARIQADNNDFTREGEIGKLLSDIPDDQFVNLLQLLSSEANDPFRQNVALKMLRHLTTEKPEEAALWALSSNPDRREANLSAVAIVWCELDSTAAVNWIRSLPEGEDRNLYSLALSSELARTDPVGAMHLVVALPPCARRDDLIATIAGEWSAKDPHSVLEWTAKLSDESIREKIVPGIANVLVDTDPALALDAVMGLPSGQMSEEALYSLVQRWGQTQPEISATWINQIPASSLRDRTIDGLVSIWSNRDPNELGRWLEKLPAGRERDEWTVKFVDRISSRDPQAAVDWAEMIVDEGERDRQLRQLANRR
jgi:hypothetical protein